jgi:hypothetical protein
VSNTGVHAPADGGCSGDQGSRPPSRSCGYRVLILDEATSALDNRTGRSQQDELDRLAARRTTITIARRCPGSLVVRTHESTRKRARHVERGTARIRSATVSHRGGRWWWSLSVVIQRTDPAPVRPSSVIGVVGIKSLAVLSTGEVIANPPSPRHSAARAAEVATPGRAPYRPPPP